MTSLLLLLIIPFVRAAHLPSAGGGPSISAQEARSSFCGRVVAVSCEGPASAVTLQIADPRGGSVWRVVIPPERRHLFGSRIEDRYEEQLVCLAPAAAAITGRQFVLVRDPEQLVVRGPTQAAIALPDDVFRTCDPEVELPTLVRQVHARFTVDAMRAKVHGSVFLRAIVDRSGVVRDIRVVHSLEPSLDDSASLALAQWEFRPATHRGAPVAVAISVQMTFTMR